MVAVEKMHETLSNLEKVTVGFIRREFNAELEGALGTDFLLRRSHVERILHVFARSLVENFKQGPVNADRENVFVCNGNSFWLGDSASMSELEVN